MIWQTALIIAIWDHLHHMLIRLDLDVVSVVLHHDLGSRVNVTLTIHTADVSSMVPFALVFNISFHNIITKSYL